MGTKHSITEKILGDLKGASDFRITLALGTHAAKMEEQRDEFLGLLEELIAIEGPQPGTSQWATKVRAALAKAGA
jgi:hypothetical protein